MGIAASTLKYWKGTLSIVIAFATPFGAWATGEASIKAAVALGVIAALTAGYNWVDQTLNVESSAAVLLSGPVPTPSPLPPVQPTVVPHSEADSSTHQ